MVLVRYLVICLIACAAFVTAHPEFFNCDGPTWVVGDAFGFMNVPTFIGPDSTEILNEGDEELEEIVNITLCHVEIIDSPTPGRYIPYETYNLKITSHEKLGHLINADSGSFDPSASTDPDDWVMLGRASASCRFYSFRTHTTDYMWTAPAPGAGDNTFHVLCGAKDGPQYTGMWVADKITLTEDAVSPSPTPTLSVSPSITPTISDSPSNTPSITPTISHTPSVSLTPSATPTISVTPSVTPTISVTISITPSASPSNSPAQSGAATVQVSMFATALTAVGAVFMAMVL